MATYTIVATGSDGYQHTALVDFTDEALGISDAKEALTPEHRSIAVARGCGGNVEFLGVWDWCEGQPRWTAEE